MKGSIYKMVELEVSIPHLPTKMKLWQLSRGGKVPLGALTKEVTKPWCNPKLRRSVLARQSHVQLAGLPPIVLVVGWKQLCLFVNLVSALCVHILSPASSAKGSRGATHLSNSNNWPASLRPNCGPYSSPMTILQTCPLEVLWQSCLLTKRPAQRPPDAPTLTILQNWDLTVVPEIVLWPAFSTTLP